MLSPFEQALDNMSEEQIASLYKTTFATSDGKLCLEDIKRRSFRNAPIAIDKQSGTIVEPNHLYLNAGMQLMCLHIEGQINYKPEQVKEFQND